MLGTAGLLHEQVRKIIEERIDGGIYKPDKPLPAVNAMAEDLGVSAITVRRALKDLQGAGKVRTVPSLGTFVSGRQRLIRHIGLPYGPVFGITDDAREAGRNVTMRHVSIEYQTPDDPALRRMGMPQERCLAFRKIILLDGEPVSVDTSFVLGEISAELIDAFSQDFVWQVLKRREIAVERTNMYFDAAPATEEFSREIGAPLGYPTIRALYNTTLKNADYELYGLCISSFDALGYYIEQ